MKTAPPGWSSSTCAMSGWTSRAAPEVRFRPLQLRRSLGELPLQRSPVHSEGLGGVADIALVFEQHLLDVFPLDAADRQGLVRDFDSGIGRCALERSDDLL